MGRFVWQIYIMKDNLKELPLEAWNHILTLVEYANKQDCIVKVDDSIDKNYLKYYDRDSVSDFYFIINDVKRKGSYNKLYFAIDTRPTNERKEVVYNILLEVFKEWVEFVKKHSKVMPKEDEELLKKYEEEFFNDIDDDSEDDYLDTDAQIRVDNLLEVIEHRLIGMNEGKNDPYIEEIKQDVIELRETQTQYKKKELKKKVARILAKMKTAGIKVLKGFWDATKKEIYKRVINGGLDDIAGYLDNFS